MKILKFLFLLPLLAIGAQALEPKVVMKPEASLKNGLYYVKGKLYDGTLKMLRYSVEDLYDVNAMGMVYPRLKPLPPTLIREIDVEGGTAVRYRDYFDGRDKPSNEYPLKNGVREGTAKHYHADSGALMGESEYKNGVRDGRYRRYYFDEGGALKQEGFFKADKREGVFTDYHVAHTSAGFETARTSTTTKAVKFEACEPTKRASEKARKNGTTKAAPWRRRANTKMTANKAFGSDFTKTAKRAW